MEALLGIFVLALWVCLCVSGYRLYMVLVERLSMKAHSHIAYISALGLAVYLLLLWSIQHSDQQAALLTLMLIFLAQLFLQNFFSRNLSVLMDKEFISLTKKERNTISHLQSLADESERTLAGIKQMFKNTQMGFIESDSKGVIRLWSDSAASITGVSSKKAVGKTLSALPFYRDIEGFIEKNISTIKAKVDDERENFEAELVIRNVKTGQARTIVGMFAGIFDPKFAEQEPVGYIASFSDVTLERKQSQEIIEKADALAKANETLERMLSVATHDLQEPSRLITTYSELAEESLASQEDARPYLSVIRQQSFYMRELVNGLLGYSRLRDHADERQDVSIKTMLDEAINILKASEKYRGHLDAISLVGDIAISADSRLLTQVFVNLITNSIKYKHAERPLAINISPSVLTSGEKGFTLSDNGIGVSDEFLPKLGMAFKRFHTRKQIEGTGLGLAMCKMVAERHHGKVFFSQNEFGGLTVSFYVG